jgi:hypothetical protein
MTLRSISRITRQVPPEVPIMLQARSSREIYPSQARHEIGEKSSEIVPLGAPQHSSFTRNDSRR